MLPIKGVSIEYRPYQKTIRYGATVNLCIFKTISMESDYGDVVITNNLYPYGDEECIVRFNADYSSLYDEYDSEIPPSDSGRTIKFKGFYNKYKVTEDKNVPSCNITVKFANKVMLDNQEHQNKPYAFSCGEAGDDFVFRYGEIAQGYTGDLSDVHLGIVKFVSGNVDGRTSAYFVDNYFPNLILYNGEGYSDINGWFTLDENGYDFTAYYTLGYTTVCFTGDPYEKGKPVHKVQLKETRGGGYQRIQCRSVCCYYYDDSGNEKMWELRITQQGNYYFDVDIAPAYTIPPSSCIQNFALYPLASTSNYLRFDVSSLQSAHYTSTIYDVIEGKDKSEWPSYSSLYKRMTISNTSPKTTYAQQKANDYIRAANVKGSSTINVDYSVGVVDTNPHTDFNLALPCTVEVEVPDCFTDPPPKYSEGLDKARMDLRCDEMYLIQIFGTDYMNLKTNEMSFAESYIPDCECGKTDRFFERY